MQTSLDSANGKISKATAYNNVLSYVAGLMEAHNGFSGWTQEEFNTGYALARKTNDQSYLDLIDYVWYNTTVDINTRIARYFVTTADNIKTRLQ